MLLKVFTSHTSNSTKIAAWLYMLPLLLLAPLTCVVAQDGTGLGFYVKAEQLRSAGQFREALDMYDRAITDDPSNYKFYYQKGKVFLVLRDEDNALHWFEKTVDVKPDYIYALTNMAWLYQRRGQYEKSVVALNQASKFEDDIRKKLDYKIKIIQMLYKIEQFEEAEPHIEEALEIQPNNLQLLYYYAHYHNLHKNHQRAREAMNRAIPLLDAKNSAKAAAFLLRVSFCLAPFRALQPGAYCFATGTLR